jgi:hypothetical protein
METLELGIVDACKVTTATAVRKSVHGKIKLKKTHNNVINVSE